MSEKSLKQLLVDQKRKRTRVKKLEGELRSEKLLSVKIDKAVVAKRAADSRKKPSPKKKR